MQMQKRVRKVRKSKIANAIAKKGKEGKKK